MSKFQETNEKFAEKVVEGYKKSKEKYAPRILALTEELSSSKN